MNLSPSLWFCIIVLAVLAFILIHAVIDSFLTWQENKAKEKRLLKFLAEHKDMGPVEAEEFKKRRDAILAKLNNDLKK